MNSRKIERSMIDRHEPTERAILPPAPPPSRSDVPHIVHPAAVYTVEDLRRVFGLKASSVRREVRLGRLRIAKRCGRYYCLGQWVLQWFTNGELKPQPVSRESKADRIEQDGRST
jgi:hypothetical protein